MPDYLAATAAGVILSLKVQPRSSKNQLAGSHDGALKVKLTAPPVDGSANKCLCEFLAKLLHVPVRHIAIIAGATSRHKRVLIKGLSCNDALDRLRLNDNF
jgi:uncharacterized protein (TIGR00251 family)